MLPFTMDHDFQKLNVIDGFNSIIWVERYYGDGDVQLKVPATTEMMAKLPTNIFLGIAESNEVMVVENRDFDEEGSMTVSGIALPQWLNQRFVRATAPHEDRYWYIEGYVPGELLWRIVQAMCVAGSPYLDGTFPTGIPNPSRLVVPYLDLESFDTSGTPIKVGVPYGPVYDALREIATTYEVGIRIHLFRSEDLQEFSLLFKSYKGIDRSSFQSENPVVRFSPFMDSFSNIKELESIASQKSLIFTFAPGNPEGLATLAGTAGYEIEPTGFDLRAELVFAEDITTDQVGGSAANLLDILNTRARDALINNHFVKVVDGEVIPDNEFKYGQDYFLGDIVEVQGRTRSLNKARVIEYIRTQDSSGLKTYPGLQILESPFKDPPPFNDNFIHAIPIACPGGTIPGTIMGATTESGELPVHFGNTVWYKIVAPFDGGLGLYVTPRGLTPIGENPSITVWTDADHDNPNTSVTGLVFVVDGLDELTFDMVSGWNYYIAIDDGGTVEDPTPHTGDFTLEWACAEPFGWRLLSSAGGPEQVENMVASGVMAYDRHREETILYYNGETWRFGASEVWEQLFPETHPTNLYQSGMAYDALNQNMVLLGGFDETATVHDETWIWDGDAETWTQVFPDTNPGVRQVPNLAWDPITERVIMATDHNETDTWSWEPGGEVPTWVLLDAEETGLGSIGDRRQASEDPTRGVLYTGADDSPGGGTWRWADGVWTSIVSDSPTGGVTGGVIAANTINNNVYLYGGSPPNKDLYEFDGDTDTWTLVPAGIKPNAEYMAYMVFDIARNRLMLWGGYKVVGSVPYNETWVWELWD